MNAIPEAFARTPSRETRYATTLALLSMLFALRVAGQALQHWAPVSLLPPFEEFQGSDLPYEILLPMQLALLAAMVVATVRIASFRQHPNARAGRILLWIGGIYMAGSVARIAIGLTVAAAPSWFSSWISGVFHVVLAAFMLVLAGFHRGRSQDTKNP